MKKRKRSGRWVHATLLAAFLGAATAAATHLPPWYAPANTHPDATVRINLEKGHGSGVHIGHGVFLTAAHVVDTSKFDVTLSDETSRPGELLWASKEYDVALVRVADFAVAPVTARLVCGPLKVGDALYAIGHPFDLGVTITNGKVAALSVGESPWREAITVDMTVGAGMSGGPVFSAIGNWLRGIVVGAYGSQLSPLAFIVPAPTLCKLLGRVS